MNRETETRLLEFATAQHHCFVAGDWIASGHPDREELAAAALFLSTTDWYGHREELVTVVEALAPGFHGRLSELVSRTQFDLSRFSNQLRRHIEYAETTS